MEVGGVLKGGWNFFSMAFILATNRNKETHFDYNAEDDTIQ